MNEPIFIARQDTLEQEILPAHWLAQYKLFGEESYTFQDKGIWKKLCMSSAGFALLQQLHQGERHGDCETGGCFGKPRICRLLRHGRSSRRFDRYDRRRCERDRYDRRRCERDRYDRRRCEFCGKKCDFGFALL